VGRTGDKNVKEKSSVKRVGILVVTHTDYGSSLIRAAEFIVGKQDGCLAISVDVSSEVEQTLQNIRESIAELDTGSGVLILTDMFGGTPTNLSLSLLGSSQLEVITGVNLPMLLKALGGRGLPLGQLAEESKAAGVHGIVVAGEVLRRRVAEG
jgi:PTS system mannose-specific IIA component